MNVIKISKCIFCWLVVVTLMLYQQTLIYFIFERQYLFYKICINLNVSVGRLPIVPPIKTCTVNLILNQKFAYGINYVINVGDVMSVFIYLMQYF